SGPDWLFDIDALTITMNYEPIVAGASFNGFAVLKSSWNDGFKPLSNDGKKVDEDPSKASECKDREKQDDVNSTNNVNTVNSIVNAADTNEHNELPFNPNMPALEDVEEPKKVIYALKDPSWIEAMQEELLQFKLREVSTLVDLPNKKRAVGTKWVFKNQKVERGIVIRNKARLMDVKSAFLYEKIKEEVYVCQPPGFEDPDFLDRVYMVEKTLYVPHQAPRAWHKGYILLVQVCVDDIIFGSTRKELCNAFERSMIDSLMYLTSSRPDIMLVVCACARYQVNPRVSYLHAVKRIFRYLKGHLKLGLWYPKDSLFDLVAYTDSDYAGASLDSKSTIGEFCNTPKLGRSGILGPERVTS
nr:hypothetical protein [Tanacetum cinerariifolium]